MKKTITEYETKTIERERDVYVCDHCEQPIVGVLEPRSDFVQDFTLAPIEDDGRVERPDNGEYLGTIRGPIYDQFGHTKRQVNFETFGHEYHLCRLCTETIFGTTNDDDATTDDA